MKKTAYIECRSGVSGDMILGAYLDLGVSLDHLKTELAKLGVEGYRIEAEKTTSYGITGTRCHVILTDVEPEHHHHDGHDHDPEGEDHQGHPHHEEDHSHDHSHDHLHDHDHPHDHEHSHDHDHRHPHDHSHGHGPDDHHGHGFDEGAAHHHHHRSYRNIRELIDRSALEDGVKTDAQAIFRRVAVAEAKVHQVSLDEVHFHEVGAVDSIVDIVGAAICHHALGADITWGSAVNVGSGFVKCAHGILPVPAPATAEILAASNYGTYSRFIKGEAATPTGVAILAELARYTENQPPFAIDAIGYGFGTRDFGVLNALRIITGHQEEESGDRITVIDTNVDDMTGEMAGYAMERLLGAGALDVFYTPIQMKKNRPALRLTVLAAAKDVPRLERMLLKETTTIGLRKYEVDRICMDRRFETRSTLLGDVTLKVCDYDGIHKVMPEYEDLRRIAREKGMALSEVMAIVAREIQPVLD